jgi:hypothetical protein
MYGSILAGIIANLITAVLYALVGISIYFVFFVMGRRRIFHFFGISNRLPTLRVYLSHMEIKRGGTQAAARYLLNAIRLQGWYISR